MPTAPCHRALPDAEATAQVLIRLIGLAQELGARRVSELRTLAAPRKRRVHGKRPLMRGAPTRPGVYLFRDRHDQVLYVGRARDLRARLRSYFQGEGQRPSVEAALLALERIEWRVLGSELEAALEELRLIRELQPPANSRSRQQNRGVYLRRRGDEFVVTRTPTELGPIGSRRQAALAARALAGATPEELDQLLAGGPLPRLRQRLGDLTESLRYEEAARLRDRLKALEHVLERLRRLEDLRALDACLIAPALTPGWRKAFFVRAGARLRRPPATAGPGARLELNAGLTIARHVPREREPLTGEQAEDMLLLGGFIPGRRPSSPSSPSTASGCPRTVAYSRETTQAQERCATGGTRIGAYAGEHPGGRRADVALQRQCLCPRQAWRGPADRRVAGRSFCPALLRRGNRCYSGHGDRLRRSVGFSGGMDCG